MQARSLKVWAEEEGFTIHVEKTKALICDIVFAYAKFWLFHDADSISSSGELNKFSTVPLSNNY